MKLSAQEMERFLKEDLKMDEYIRNKFKLPNKKYYSVSLNKWNYGEIIIDNTRERIVESKKISKSDQP